MPPDHGLRFYDRENIRPARPELSQGGPEEAIRAGQCRARPFALEYRDLLPQREDFQGSIHATAEEDADRSQECGNQIEHELTLCNAR